MEEPSLVRQLVTPGPHLGPAPGERRGFGDVPWGLGRVALVTFTGFFLSVGTMPVGVFATRGGTEAAAAFAMQVSLSYALIVALVLTVGMWGHRSRWEALGFRPLDVRSLAGLLAMMAGVILAVNLLSGVFVDLPHPRSVLMFGKGPTQIGLVAFLILVIAPLAEEIFFRGFLLQGLVQRMTFWPAAILSSAVFAVAHATWQVMPPIFVLGVALAWLFWRTGSLWASVAAHATINGSSLVVLLLLG